MYDPRRSYEDNWQEGPFFDLTRQKKPVHVLWSEAPRHSFLGVPLHIPFGVPAGPLLRARHVKAYLDAGFSLPVYKTVRDQRWPSHPWPNVLCIRQDNLKGLPEGNAPEFVATPFAHPNDFSKPSITNSFGVPSQSPKDWSADYLSLKGHAHASGTILSFQGSRHSHEGLGALVTSSQKTAEMAAECISSAGTTLLEINLSCPNEGGAPLYADLDATRVVLTAVGQVLKSYPHIKLIAKLGTLSSENTRRFLGENADVLQGVSSINTVSGRILTPTGQAALGPDRPTGGVCGHLIQSHGLRAISLLSHHRESLGLKGFGICGVGGVLAPADVLRYRDAGADVTQAATGAMWNLALASEVAQALGIPHTLHIGDAP